MHTIGIKQFKNIKASYLQNGPAARVHGNKGRKPKKTLTLQEVKDVVQFILNYAGITEHSRIIRQSLSCIHTEANAMVLPGELYHEAATEFHETCWLLHLHRVVEATLTIHRRRETND